MEKMSQEEKMLLLINNYDYVINEESAKEVAKFHLEDINLDWEHQPHFRLNYLTEYFREQKITNGGLNYFTMAAHINEKALKVFFNVQLNRQVVERLCSALPDPVILVEYSTPLESQSNLDDLLSMYEGSLSTRINLRELVTAENRRDDCDFYNATLSAPILWTNVPVSGIPPNSFRRGLILFEGAGCRGRFNLSVGWKEPSVKIKDIQISTQYFMEKLFQDEETKDLTIVAGNGAEIKCHRIIFSAHSSAFSRMLFSRIPTKEAIFGRFEMLENSQVGVQTLIKYLYGMPMIIEDLSGDVAVELFQTAHKFHLSHLEGALIRLFMKMELSWFTADAILELYLFVRNLDTLKDLREHCLLLMTSMNMKDLRVCEEFQKLDSLHSTDVLLEIVECLQKRVPNSEERGVKAEGDEA